MHPIRRCESDQGGASSPQIPQTPSSMIKQKLFVVDQELFLQSTIPNGKDVVVVRPKLDEERINEDPIPRLKSQTKQLKRYERSKNATILLNSFGTLKLFQIVR